MTPRLRHQIEDDTVLITTVIDGRPVAVHIAHQEAKRFAWALLSDLDPEEAAELQPEPPAFVQSFARGQKLAVLRLLASHDADTRRIANHIGRDMDHASSVISQARQRGLVTCVVAGSPGLPATWGITLGGRGYVFERAAVSSNTTGEPAEEGV